MKFVKNKLVLVGGVVTLFVLAIVVLLTVVRVGQEKPVAPTAPEDQEAAEITLNVPDDYGSCSTQPFSDTVTTSGVGTRTIRGYLELQYISGTDRILVQRFDIDQVGDISVTINYPPVYEWTPHPNGTREAHVDISLEVYEGDVKIATLGPGQDWDVFCTANIPSAPPSTAPSPSATPRLIPSASPTARPIPTTIATPRPSPSPSTTAVPTATPGTGGINPSPSPSPSPTSTPAASPTPTATPGTGGPNPSPSPNPSPTATPAGAPLPSSSTTPSVPVSGTSLPTLFLLIGAMILIGVSFVF